MKCLKIFIEVVVLATFFILIDCRSSFNAITTIMGTGTNSNSGTNGLAVSASVSNPRAVQQDSVGNLYVLEQGAYCVRKISSSDNIVQKFAGVCGTSDSSGDSGAASSALFSTTMLSIFVSSIGTVYLSDYVNVKIRVVSVSNILTVFAGTGVIGPAGDGGQATAADLFQPLGVWGNTMGLIYSVSDGGRVRAIATSGIITTFAGSTAGFSGDGGPATSASLNTPRRAFGDTTGVLYVADSINNRIRKITGSGIISTFAGFGGSSYTGDNVAPTSTFLDFPADVSVDSANGDVYMNAYAGSRVFVINTITSGLTTLLAGNGGTNAVVNNIAATAASVTNPDGICLSSSGALYVVAIADQRVYSVYSTSPALVPSLSPSMVPSLSPTQSPTTVKPSVSFSPTVKPTTTRSSVNYISTLVGTGSPGSTGTGGKATAANIQRPRQVVQDTAGVIYYVEDDSNCVRQFNTADMILKVYAGVCNSAGTTGDSGPASSALLNYPTGLFMSTTSVAYIAEYNSHRARSVSVSGIMSTVVGTGVNGYTGDGGQATAAQFTTMHGVGANTLGVLYLVGIMSYIRTVSTSGIITTLGGTTIDGYSGDGGMVSSATFHGPTRVFCDTSGVVYITDTSNYIVRAVSTTSIINKYIGSGSPTYAGEGVARTSQGMGSVADVTIDPANGDVYVSSYGGRVFLAAGGSGLVTTLAGLGTAASSGDGGAASSAALNAPDGLLLLTSGTLYVAEVTGLKVRSVFSPSPSAAPSVIPSIAPSVVPSVFPSQSPSVLPSIAPSVLPSALPSIAPTVGPSIVPSLSPTVLPSIAPSVLPSALPSIAPTVYPSIVPSLSPTVLPSIVPSVQPSVLPTIAPSAAPSALPSLAPSASPSHSRSSSFVINHFAGTGAASSSGTGGTATAASFFSPRNAYQDTAGVTYVSEQGAHCVRQISTSGIVSNFAGVCNAASGYSGDGGAASSALLSNNVYCIVNTMGVLYVSDYNGNNNIRSVSVAGIISTYAGTGVFGSSGDGGAATSAAVTPHGIWADSLGNMYIAPLQFDLFRRISNSGIISLFAGTGGAGFSGDGGAATSATVNRPIYGGCDTGGNVFLSDYNNLRVRVVSSSGIITTFAGNGDQTYNGEGLAATSAAVGSVTGVVVDRDNHDVYIAKFSADRVYVVTGSTGLTNTFAGGGTVSALDTTLGDGGAATAGTFKIPDGLFLDSAGVLYVTDETDNRIRVVISVTSVAPTVMPSVSPSTVPSLLPTVTYLPISSSPNYKVVNAYAFAGLTSAGAVMTWGASASGGDSSSVSLSLKSGVKSVVSSKNAFAAVKSDGSVVAWGRSAEISGWTAYSSAASNVVSLVGSEQAFAGITGTGGVIAFGADCCGGNVDQYGWAQYLTSGVSSIAASAGAFCALKSDGSVYCWGSKFAGGGVSSVIRSDIAGVVLLVASRSSFAVITSGGGVVVWGVGISGGSVSSTVAPQLTTTQHILSAENSFAAYTGTNNVHSWGYSGDVTGLSGVSYVAHSAGAFAALKTDNTVVAWGDSNLGGDASSVSSALIGVSSLVGSEGAFAALTAGGSVVAWGSAERGGQLFGNVSSGMGVVQSVYHTRRAFAAVSTSGAVTVWGATYFGGVMSSGVSSQLTSGVKLICANDVSFTAIKSDGSAYGWGYSGANLGIGLLAGDYSSIASC